MLSACQIPEPGLNEAILKMQVQNSLTMARVIFGDHYRVTTSRQFFVVLYVKLTLAAVRPIGCNRNNTLVGLEKGSLESVRYLRTLLGDGF